DRGVDALDVRSVGEPRPLLLGSRSRQCLPRGLEIAREGIERRLRDDVLLEKLGLPVIVLLRELELRGSPFSGRRRLVEGGFQLLDVLLGFRQRRLLLVDDILVRLGIDTKQGVAFLERCVRLHRYLDHAPPHRRQHGGHREVDAGVVGEGVIVVHDQQDQGDANDPAQRRRRERQLVDRYLENLEDRVAERNVDQGQQELHYRSPAMSLPSSSATRRRRSSNSLELAAGPAPDAGACDENPQPRSGRYDIAQIHRNGHSACSVNRLTHPAAWIASWWGWSRFFAIRYGISWMAMMP